MLVCFFFFMSRIDGLGAARQKRRHTYPVKIASIVHGYWLKLDSINCGQGLSSYEWPHAIGTPRSIKGEILPVAN